MGSWVYGAPELFESAGRADARADVFSLAMMLRRLVTGALPLDPDDERAVWSFYLGHTPLPSLAEEAPDLPAAVVALLERCLAVDPAERLADAGALMAELEGTLAAPAPVSRRPRPSPRSRRLAPRADASRPGAAPESVPKPLPVSDGRPGGWNRRWASAGAVVVGLGVLGLVVAPHDEVPNRSRTHEAPKEDPGDEPIEPEPEAPLPEGFVRVAPGTFTMGAPDSEAWRHKDERPTREVTLSRAFALQATEVTQGQWRTLMGNNPSSFASCGDDCPVETVNWYDALAYMNALSARDGLAPCYELTGCSGRPGATRHSEEVYICERAAVTAPDGHPASCSGYRLPTEAEWEYAARAGTTKARDGNLRRIAWYDQNAANETHPVGKKRPNAWGAHDMLGNVEEWTWDRYGAYAGEPVTDPVQASADPHRVSRGCRHNASQLACRLAKRHKSSPVRRNAGVGFRAVRTLAEVFDLPKGPTAD
jgi:formylglycine-generating enzyme required for sulfatase activity